MGHLCFVLPRRSLSLSLSVSLSRLVTLHFPSAPLGLICGCVPVPSFSLLPVHLSTPPPPPPAPPFPPLSSLGSVAGLFLCIPTEKRGRYEAAGLLETEPCRVNSPCPRDGETSQNSPPSRGPYTSGHFWVLSFITLIYFQ